MIQNFRHKGLKLLHEKGDQSKVPPEQVRRIRLVLMHLQRAQGPDDMDVQGLHTHALTGNLSGF